MHFLEPIDEKARFRHALARPALLSEVPADRTPGLVVAKVYRVGDRKVEDVVTTFEQELRPAIEQANGVVLGIFKSSTEENNFPLLPYVDDSVVVSFYSVPDRATHDELEQIEAKIDPERLSVQETLLLEPGARSRLIHRPSN